MRHTYEITRVNTDAPALMTTDADLALTTGEALSVVWEDGTVVRAFDVYASGVKRNNRSVHFAHGELVFVLDWEAWTASELGSGHGMASLSNGEWS